MQYIRQLYLHRRFFLALLSIAILFLMSYWFSPLYAISWVLLWLFAMLTLLDMVLLFRTAGIMAQRALPERFSNSDPNTVRISLKNIYPFTAAINVIDELPIQFQIRDFSLPVSLTSGESSTLHYELVPFSRGTYVFGSLRIFINSPLGLVIRRLSFQQAQTVKVYPSFIQMRRYDFLAFQANQIGSELKKVRKLGHTMEFEQIKAYIPGDDSRALNWKATGKTGLLMVNQYQEEKSQAIYTLIDSGRSMKMPFDGLTLLDYAINSTLALSNVILRKGDKCGLLQFDTKVQKAVAAKQSKVQLGALMDALYNINTGFEDTDFSKVYAWVRQKISQRSLLIIYTNFEHLSGLTRQMPYLKGLSRHHHLVVVFFENSLLKNQEENLPKSWSDVVLKNISGKFIQDKKLMVRELEQYGISCIYCPPQQLSLASINKYLEIKQKGWI
jgi:uncharacterized protein (DUF58 family)